MGYLCLACGEALPDGVRCPCQAISDEDPYFRLDRDPRRSRARRSRQMQANGPVESSTRAEIGRRDDWICGICGDRSRPVDPSASAPRALAPSLDHIRPLSAGGSHTRDNVQIAHLWCNIARGSRAPAPQYLRAGLAEVLDGTPLPEELYRGSDPAWQWPASPHSEYLIALQVVSGRLAPDPRYGEPAERLAEAARRFGGNSRDAVDHGLDLMARFSGRRAVINAWWRASREPEEP
jgi:5-methylcytosine-specific restriction endonuclease McrA